ncbi:MAG: hypothetical protein Q8Q14_03860 [Gemmatimonadales bacterium]|nr:hypothetical protein [Gemmatimonadales bacterium]
MILNLTQHAATAEQISAGVVDCSPERLADLRRALTFEALPGSGEVAARAETIAELAVSAFRELDAESREALAALRRAQADRSAAWAALSVAVSTTTAADAETLLAAYRETRAAEDAARKAASAARKALVARAAYEARKRVAMIGGAPFLMAPLEAALGNRGCATVYAFSVRESAEEVLPDGSTRKVAVFRHRGFVQG